MVEVIAKYAFWIIICLPLIAAGIWLFIRLIKENRVINKEIDDRKKEKELAIDKRKVFEQKYSKKYSKR